VSSLPQRDAPRKGLGWTPEVDMHPLRLRVDGGEVMPADDIDAKVREHASRIDAIVDRYEPQGCFHVGDVEDILRDLAAEVERATERKALLAAADEIRRYATTWADDATGRYGSGRRSGFRLAEERVRRMALLPLPAPSHDPVSRVAAILDSREQEMTPEQRETARAAVRDIASKLPSHEGAEPETGEPETGEPELDNRCPVHDINAPACKC
jgi:hypothetical protein